MKKSQSGYQGIWGRSSSSELLPSGATLASTQANPVIRTTSKANAGLREVMKSKVIVHRIDSRAFFGFAFFGFEYLSFSGLFVPVSLPEKILLAFMYFQKELDPVTRQALINGSSRKVLRDFAERMGSRYLAQVDSLIDEYEHHR